MTWLSFDLREDVLISNTVQGLTSLANYSFLQQIDFTWLVDEQLDFDLVLVAQDEGRKCNMGQACRHSLGTF